MSKAKSIDREMMARIDRAIVMTQFDLRGFDHPAAGRLDPMASAKCLNSVPANLIAMCCCDGESREPVVPWYIRYRSKPEHSYEEHVSMCQQLAACCEGSEKEAIQLIILEILKQDKQMKEEVEAGTREKGYLYPLEKDSLWGRTMLALIEAFEVDITATV